MQSVLPGFELVSPCPFPTTITITPRSLHVSWYINHCRLFNAKSSLYIYIKYIRFGWLGLWLYILNIYDLVGLGFMAYQPV